MPYRLLADLILLFHLAFLLYVVAGGLLMLRWPHTAWLHLPAAAWGTWTELASIVCPLTPLENYFRRLGGQAGYAGGFIEHYVTGTLYPEGLTREIQGALGATGLLLNSGLFRVLRHR